jgi:hypothetical protein
MFPSTCVAAVWLARKMAQRYIELFSYRFYQHELISKTKILATYLVLILLNTEECVLLMLLLPNAVQTGGNKYNSPSRF